MPQQQKNHYQLRLHKELQSQGNHLRQYLKKHLPHHKEKPLLNFQLHIQDFRHQQAHLVSANIGTKHFPQVRYSIFFDICSSTLPDIKPITPIICYDWHKVFEFKNPFRFKVIVHQNLIHHLISRAVLLGEECFLNPFITATSYFNDFYKQKLPSNWTINFILIFSPPNLGSLMYNKTDGAGWCFTAFCNLTCNVEKLARLCQSTTPPPSTTVIITTAESSPSTTSAPTTPFNVGCSFLTPPRKVLQFKCSTSWLQKHCLYSWQILKRFV